MKEGLEAGSTKGTGKEATILMAAQTQKGTASKPRGHSERASRSPSSLKIPLSRRMEKTTLIDQAVAQRILMAELSRMMTIIASPKILPQNTKTVR